MKNKRISIFFNGGEEDGEIIGFSTEEKKLNRISNKEMDSLIKWVENGPETYKIECENGRIFFLFRKNINYVKVEEV